MSLDKWTKLPYKSILGEEYELTFRKTSYANNKSLAVEVMCQTKGEPYEEPFGMLTVNLAKPPQSGEGCAYLDTNNMPEDLLEMLEEVHIFERTEVYQRSGFCIYPEVRFNSGWLEAISE